MMKRTMHILAVALAVAVVAGMAGCSRTTTTNAGETTAAPTTGTSSAGTTNTTGAQKIILRYAFFASEETFPGRQMEWWASEIERWTDGQVSVQTIPEGDLFSAETMYEGVRSGVADVGLSFVSYEPGRFPLLTLNDLPGLGYESATQASKAFFDVVWANQDIEELKDFQVITAFCTEPAYLQTVKECSTLASLSGIPIRTPGGPKVLEALGALGVSMPQSDIAMGLDNFLIEGILTSREVLKDFNYVLNKPISQVSALAVMKKDAFEALPENVKKVIEELAPLAAAYAGERLDAAVQDSMRWAVDTQGVKVVQLSDEEARKFDDTLASVTSAWLADIRAKGLPADDFFRQLQEAAVTYKE